jgi:predicted metalloprotease
MKWTPSGPSRNLEDQRGVRLGGGGGGMMKYGIGGFLVLGIGSILLNTNLFALVEGTGMAPASEQQTSGPVQSSAEEDRAVQFVSFVLDDVQGTWKRMLPQYRDAKLVLFRDAVNSGCGTADAGVGPFYCPLDEKAYLDLSFFDELHTRFGAAGDFAQAYVLAHEIGHHVQHILGTDERMRAAQQRSPAKAGQLSVAMELQADCLAGVWGNSTQQRSILENGDVAEALGAAAAIGDDRLQKQAGRQVNPESWTHGSSAQRQEWFTRGLKSGRVDNCDTFGGAM